MPTLLEAPLVKSTPTLVEPQDPREEKTRLLLEKAKHALERIFTVPGLSFSARLSHAKQINQQLTSIEMGSGVAELSGWPSMIDLPVAGKCNLRCTMCGLSHGDPGYPNWTLDEVKRFEPMFRYANLINPTGAGEPLSNRDFYAMLELFTSYGTTVGFYTNATLLNEDRIERIIRLGVQQVNISIDGATQETFEDIRHHAKFATVVGNARRLVARRKELQRELPRLQIAMVLMRQNMHELPDLVRLAKDIGADQVYVGFVSGIVPEWMCEREPVRTNRYLREARQVAQALQLPLRCPDYLPEEDKIDEQGAAEAVTPFIPDVKGTICSLPWKQMTVWNDGNVSPCCAIRDDVEGEKFASIHDGGTPAQLWNSPGMVRLRQRLAEGAPPHACVICPIRTSHARASA